MNHPIKIHFKDGARLRLQLAHLVTPRTNISLEEPVKSHEGVFVALYHNKVQSFLDVTGVPEHVLLLFNRDKEYIGFNPCIASGDSSYIIGTRAKYAILLPDKKFPYEIHQISHLETEYDVNIEMA